MSAGAKEFAYFGLGEVRGYVADSADFLLRRLLVGFYKLRHMCRNCGLFALTLVE